MSTTQKTGSKTKAPEKTVPRKKKRKNAEKEVPISPSVLDLEVLKKADIATKI